MQLPIRGLPFEVPSYSLTGDIMAFQRCGLQYRYYNRSSLPPSRPVQLWTGEFVHGVLEDAYLHWHTYQTPFPWPYTPTPWPRPPIPLSRLPYDVGEIGDRVEERLRAAGKTARDREARDAAYKRVQAALSFLAPHLFPLITAVEERLGSTRPMPPITGPVGQAPRGDRYELTGRVDVISSVSLATQQTNPLVSMISNYAPGLTGQFDVIVDYKAARRPPKAPTTRQQKDYWQLEAWQVQTYAWLRKQQPSALPVKEGILVYINELSPSQTDLDELKKEIAQGCTDVQPPNGSTDYYALHSWRKGSAIPAFTSDFLLQRAIRIVSVNDPDINHAVIQIDQAVNDIESCALNENATGTILGNWNAIGDDKDCDACDFRRFCPSPAQSRGSSTQGIRPPVAPG